MSSNTTYKRVRVWAVIDKKGLVVAECNKPQFMVYGGSDRTVLHEDAQIVRCTILLPSKPLKRAKR